MESNKIITALTIYKAPETEKDFKLNNLFMRLNALSEVYFKQNKYPLITITLVYLFTAFFTSCLFFFNPLIFWGLKILSNPKPLISVTVIFSVLTVAFGLSLIRRVFAVLNATFVSAVSAFALSYVLTLNQFTFNSFFAFFLVLVLSFLTVIFSVNCYAVNIIEIVKLPTKSKNIRISVYLGTSAIFICLIYLLLQLLFKYLMIG